MSFLSLQLHHFNRVFESWRFGVAHVRAQYVAVFVEGSWVLVYARVDLDPFELTEPLNQAISTSSIRAGHVKVSVTQSELEDFMAALRAGRLHLSKHSLDLALPADQEISSYAPTPMVEPEYFTPELEVKCMRQTMLTQSFDYALANAELRRNAVPFDGMVDLLSFFGLGNSGHLPHEQKILVTLNPPGDIIFDGCSLSQDCLRLKVMRRVSLGRDSLVLGLRKIPNPSMERRSQIADKIQWQPEAAGFETGYVETSADDCSVAELLLSVGGYTVRRYFLPDVGKSLNQRLVDYRRFDPELQHLGRALKAGKNDSRSLEAGVATLLHLLGASTLTPPNPDTPDVIAETIGKRLALIECTIKVESLREKVGKLVNRRELINRENGLNSPTREVLAILVVNQPRHTIVNEDKYLSDNQVVLIAQEDLNLAMAHLEVPQDLDMHFLEKLDSLRLLNNKPFGSIPDII
jgi:hypothetical protein